MKLRESGLNPKVSIISGYYNREDYVLDSITSLLKQTFVDIEVIVFDDFSTDSTYQKLKELAIIDNRIVPVSYTENRGFVKGLIDAIAIAKGDYVAIHGSGDISMPSRIEKQVNFLEQNPQVGLVGCYVENVELGVEGETVSLWEHNVSGKCIDLLREHNLFTHGEVMFKRSLYDKVGGYRSFFTFTQDYDLWSRMAIYSEFYTIPEVLYRRYLRTDGASVVPEKRLLQSILGVIVKKNIQFVKDEIPDLVDKYGDHAIDSITEMPKYSVALLSDRVLAVLKDKGKESALAKRTIKLLSKQRGQFFLGLLLRVFIIFPDRIIKALAKDSRFQYLISVAVYKLP